MISRSVALVALAFLPIAVSATEVTRAQYLMGTVCEIATDGDPREIDAAFSEASRVERFLSTWRDDSELSALNRGDMNAASPELRTLLDRVIMWRDRTSGAFEPRIRPLIDAWQTRGGGTVPSPESIADAMKLIRSGRGAFEEGGFGKGYAIDRMLASTNAPHVVINFGGQIAVRGEKRVAIADPERRDVGLVDVTLRNASLSTSSGSEKSFNVGGRRFSHVIDPRTGQALPPRGSVSVIAPDALTADVLSTALYVMGSGETETVERDLVAGRDRTDDIVRLSPADRDCRYHAAGDGRCTLDLIRGFRRSVCRALDQPSRPGRRSIRL